MICLMPRKIFGKTDSKKKHFLRFAQNFIFITLVIIISKTSLTDKIISSQLNLLIVKIQSNDIAIPSKIGSIDDGEWVTYLQINDECSISKH